MIFFSRWRLVGRLFGCGWNGSCAGNFRYGFPQPETFVSFILTKIKNLCAKKHFFFYIDKHVRYFRVLSKPPFKWCNFPHLTFFTYMKHVNEWCALSLLVLFHFRGLPFAFFKKMCTTLKHVQSRWWFQFFWCSPRFGEDSHFDSYFWNGLKPPTSQCFCPIVGVNIPIIKDSLLKVGWVYPHKTRLFVPGSTWCFLHILSTKPPQHWLGRIRHGSKRTPTYPWSIPQASPNLQMKGIPS